MNNDPCIRITTEAGEVLEATPNNTHLFLYMGDLASRSHIFIETGRDDDTRQTRGAFIFKTIQPDAYSQMLPFLVQHEYPSHANLREISPGDERAYQQAIEEAAVSEAGGIDSELEGLFDGE